jgi:hypothetical protein
MEKKFKIAYFAIILLNIATGIFEVCLKEYTLAVWMFCNCLFILIWYRWHKMYAKKCEAYDELMKEFVASRAQNWELQYSIKRLENETPARGKDGKYKKRD